jgi:hypothetical protein
MASNIPPDLNGHEQETGSWIGVGSKSNVGILQTSDGKQVAGASIAWGSDTPKGAARRAAKEKYEPNNGEEMTEPTIDLTDRPPKETDGRPVPMDLDDQWVLQFMQTGGYVIGGLKVAPALTSPKGWALPSLDGQRTLFLLSSRAYSEGMELFREAIDEYFTEGYESVFPSSMRDLLSDPNIGPAVSLMGPSERSERLPDPDDPKITGNTRSLEFRVERANKRE